jgi:hypothetical protein
MRPCRNIARWLAINLCLAAHGIVQVLGSDLVQFYASYLGFRKRFYVLSKAFNHVINQYNAVLLLLRWAATSLQCS